VNILSAVLALPLVVFASAAWASASEDLARFYDRVRTVNGRFEQVLIDESGKQVEKSAGQFWISRPGRFRWDYAQPYSQEIVADGERVWVYDADLKQVSVRAMNASLGSTPALLLAGSPRVRDQFTIRDLPARGDLQWAELKPKARDSGLDAVRVGFAAGRLRVLELADGFGQTTRVTFSDTRENDTIDKGRFAFRTPPGVDVIRE
jgi:outer membrane lipoprotein carrier protein